MPAQRRNLADYAAIFSLNTVKDPAEEDALAACERDCDLRESAGDSQTAMTRRFTDRARRPLPRAVAGPENEYVVISRSVDIDLVTFPAAAVPLPQHAQHRLSTSVIAAPRPTGAKSMPGWKPAIPTTANRAASGLRDRPTSPRSQQQAAGEPITRLTHIDVILDDLEPNGQFSLDVDYLRFVTAAGEIGWEESFDTADNWSVHATIEGVPGGQGAFRVFGAEGRGNHAWVTSICRPS